MTKREEDIMDIPFNTGNEERVGEGKGGAEAGGLFLL